MKTKIILVATVGVLAFLGSVEWARGQYQCDDSRFERRHHDDSRDFRSDRGYGRNDPDAIVRRAYEDILDREPDQQGLRTYRSRIIDDNWSERDVRNDLRKSAEHAGRTPATAELIVRRAYQDMLGRDPDPSGLALYRSKIVNEGWSERDVRSDLMKSSERRETGGISGDQAQQMVRRAYQSVLGREPDSSGLALYVQKIRQNRWSEADVAKELRNSSEYRRKQGKN